MISPSLALASDKTCKRSQATVLEYVSALHRSQRGVWVSAFHIINQQFVLSLKNILEKQLFYYSSFYLFICTVFAFSASCKRVLYQVCSQRICLPFDRFTLTSKLFIYFVESIIWRSIFRMRRKASLVKTLKIYQTVRRTFQKAFKYYSSTRRSGKNNLNKGSWRA